MKHCKVYFQFHWRNNIAFTSAQNNYLIKVYHFLSPYVHTHVLRINKSTNHDVVSF